MPTRPRMTEAEVWEIMCDEEKQMDMLLKKQMDGDFDYLERRNDVFELFCGSGNLSKHFIHAGYKVRSYDLKIDDENMIPGFKKWNNKLGWPGVGGWG